MSATTSLVPRLSPTLVGRAWEWGYATITIVAYFMIVSTFPLCFTVCRTISLTSLLQCEQIDFSFTACILCMTSLVPRPHPWGEGLVTSGWFLWLHYKFIACCMDSWEPTTNLCTKKSAVSSCWSSQELPVLQYRLCFLQCDWRREISLQK